MRSALGCHPLDGVTPGRSALPCPSSDVTDEMGRQLSATTADVLGRQDNIPGSETASGHPALQLPVLI